MSQPSRPERRRAPRTAARRGCRTPRSARGEVRRRIGDYGDGHRARLARRVHRPAAAGASVGSGRLTARRRHPPGVQRRASGIGAPGAGVGPTPSTAPPAAAAPSCCGAAAATDRPAPSARSMRSWPTLRTRGGARGPRPSSRSISRPAVPPCVTTTAVPTGGSSASAASARSATAAGSSPPRPRTGRPAIQSAYCSGNRSATSARVRPSQEPMPCSRNRASSRSGTPRRPVSTGRCPRPGPGRWRPPRCRPAAAPRPDVRRGQAAWLRPSSSSGGSSWPWKRPAAFHSVRPCRHSTSRGTGQRGQRLADGHRPVVVPVGGRVARRRSRRPRTRPAAPALSTNGMVGQSFHSRSRA